VIASLVLLSMFMARAKEHPQPEPNIPWQIQAEFERARADEGESARIHDSDLARERMWLDRAQQYCNDTFGVGYEVVRDRGLPMFCKKISGEKK